MIATQRQHSWNERLASFNRENFGRPTRLAVFESSNAGMNDFWLEDGLPFKGVSFEERDGHVAADISLEGFAHFVKNARRIELVYCADGQDDGLNILDSSGKTSMLRFE